MTAKFKLTLRRVRNRKQLKVKQFKQAWKKTYTGFESVPLKIYVDGKPIEDNTQIFLNPNVMPSNLPGFRWVKKTNPNDGTGLSWHEERIE